MMQPPQLIVMLTYNDHTVLDAAEIFARCKDSKAEFWGFKEAPLPLEQMKTLYRSMKDAGKTTFLEVVEYTERECLAGAQMAAECGCDVLMGTVFSDAVNAFCRDHGIRYMPFVGEIVGRPSVLTGTLAGMVAEAERYLAEACMASTCSAIATQAMRLRSIANLSLLWMRRFVWLAVSTAIRGWMK